MTNIGCCYNHRPIRPEALKPVHECEWQLERRLHDPDDHGDIEGWCVDVPAVGAYEDGCQYEYAHTLFFYDDEPQARLATAAPEMARVLLAVEWRGRQDYVGDGGYDCCPSCEGIAPAHLDNTDARWDVERGRNIVGHRPDCALDAAIEKAGLR